MSVSNEDIIAGEIVKHKQRIWELYHALERIDHEPEHCDCPSCVYVRCWDSIWTQHQVDHDKSEDC
jgi:hypothetical protein